MFDMDGVLLDSEGLWDGVRREVASEFGGRWRPEATAAMQGMSSHEWARYMTGELGVRLDEADVIEHVTERLLTRYAQELPSIPGARRLVDRVATRWPVAIASSSQRAVIDRVLALAGWTGTFAVIVSSEEVARGKPSPDVYLEVARRLSLAPADCVAIEDSTNGIRSALDAGMAVVAMPNRDYPPAPDVLALVAAVAEHPDQVTVGMLEELHASTGAPAVTGHDEARVDEEEMESFPASDPHADWAGPGG